MKIALATLCLALAFTCSIAENPDFPAVTTYPASAFTLNATRPSANALSTGGYSDKRSLQQWPALAGSGISMTAFTLEPCALRPPHVHQYASGVLYVISASNLSVGFTTTNGTGISTTVTNGASTLFPQGLLHYQQNLGCDTATYTISYGSDNAGTQVLAPGLLGLPMSVVMATLGTSNMTEVMAVPTGDFIARSDASCVQRCAGSMAPSMAVSTAGK